MEGGFGARAVRDEDDGGGARAGGEGLLQQLLPLHGLDGPPERVRGGEVVVECERPERQHPKRERRDEPGGAVAALDPAPEAAPDRATGRRPRAEPRHEGPEGTPAAQQQERRKQRQHCDRRDCDPHRANRPQARRGVDLREGQAEERRDHGPGGRRDRGARPAERDLHRIVLVLDAEKLFAVARGEEQGVVRSRSEDEHQEDAARLPVDDEPGVRQQRPDTTHDALGEEHGEKRQRPEDRAPIDEHEEDEHQSRGREEKRGVDALERLGGIRGEAGRPRDPRLEPGREVLAHQLARTLDGVDEDLLVPVGADGDRDHGGLAVLRQDGRGQRPDSREVRALQPLACPGHRGAPLRSEPATVAEDGDRRGLLT